MRLLNFRQVCKFVGIAERTGREWLKDGRLPPPSVRLASPKGRRWVLDDLVAALKGAGEGK